jgi:hypothetical protein
LLKQAGVATGYRERDEMSKDHLMEDAAPARTEAEQENDKLRATLGRIKEMTERHPFTTRDWFRSLFAGLERELAAQPTGESVSSVARTEETLLPARYAVGEALDLLETVERGMLGDSPFRRRVKRFMAATNRTEAEPLHGANDVFKAERAVLDAWGAVSVDTLYMWATHPSEHVRNTCRAELARRGLKSETEPPKESVSSVAPTEETIWSARYAVGEQVATVRDNLRAMFVAWHKRGPHATYDALVIEKAILDLSALTK